MQITVMEPFHSVFYAPHYVALHLGHFKAEGFDVTTRTGASSAGTTRALIEGSAQISLGGLMRSLDIADRGGRLLPHFAEVNSRNGFFLIGRQPAGFAWPNIVGRTVISFTGAPTPYQSMLTVLRREGVDPARVTFVRDLSPADAVVAFRAGRGDFIEVGQPTAEMLLDDGFHLAMSMGDATGPVPFSSYMTLPDRLRHEPELIVAFTRAVYRTQRWIATHDAKAVSRRSRRRSPTSRERCASAQSGAISPRERGRATRCCAGRATNISSTSCSVAASSGAATAIRTSSTPRSPSARCRP